MPFQSLLLFTTVLFLAFIPRAHADFYFHSWEDHHSNEQQTDLQFSSAYYNSPSNFDPTGQIVTPSGLTNYARIYGDILLTHGYSDRFSIYGRASWAYINQSGSTQPGTAFGFSDQSVGFNIRILEKHIPTQTKKAPPVALDLQFQLDAPTYSNSPTLPAIGDGTWDTTAGGFFSATLSAGRHARLETTLGGGFTYRSANFSSHLPWLAALRYAPYQDGLVMRVQGSGIVSLKNDLYGSGSTPRSSTASGGSFFTGGTNPSLINLTAQIGYQFTLHTELFLAGTKSMWGQNSPNGFSALLGFQTRIGHGSKDNPLQETPGEFGHANAGFQRYSLDARVLSNNDRMNLVKINKGSEDGVEAGQIFDIFETDKDGRTGEPIARGTILKVRVDNAALEITEYFREVGIDVGFLAKRLVQ